MSNQANYYDVVNDLPLKKDNMRKVRMVVAATDANGSPALVHFKVRMASWDIEDGHHYDVAKDYARKCGYEGEMVAFDKDDGPEFLFKSFKWKDADVVEE